MKKLIIFFLLTIAGSFSKTYAQKTLVAVDDKNGWIKIGEATVNFEVERDEMVLLGKNKFTALQFKVKEEAIELLQMEIYYDNGDKQAISIGQGIKSPGESRILELNGGERVITKVAFEYKTLPNWTDNKRARIELWGLKTGN